jgi:xanthine dehydrogenase accessory factor
VKDIARDVERWRERGDAHVAVATVVATRGSAPRPLGSKLAVSEQGELAGSVSGGCVEGDVAVQAREVLAEGEPRLLTYGIADDLAWSVGLPCGGEIDVFLERLALEWHTRRVPPPGEHIRTFGGPFRPTLYQSLVEASREAGVVFTFLDGENIGAKLIRSANGSEHGTVEPGFPDALRREAVDLLRGGRNRLLEVDERKVFAEVYGPPPVLLVYGAVDTAEALCALARPLGWKTVVADARARFLTEERMPSADDRIVGWPEDVLAQVPPDFRTAIVVLTHDDKFDVPLLKAALDTDALYIGALGSRRNQTRRRERLLEEGVSEEALARIHGPAGLDLGSSTPAETALAILAEIVAVRAGRTGGSLSASRGRIHADPDATPVA